MKCAANHERTEEDAAAAEEDGGTQSGLQAPVQTNHGSLWLACVLGGITGGAAGSVGGAAGSGGPSATSSNPPKLSSLVETGGAAAGACCNEALRGFGRTLGGGLYPFGGVSRSSSLNAFLAASWLVE